MSTPRSHDAQAASLTSLRSAGVQDSPRGWRWLVGLVMVAHCGLGVAAEQAGSAEIERIARERAAVERNAQVAQAACAERFAVNSCIERVKAERRERLLQLNRERAAIDDARRKERAAERAAVQIQRKADPAASSPDKAARVGKPSASATAPRPPRHEDTAQREAAAIEAEATAARRAEVSIRRAERAQAHREAAERRTEVNAASKAPAKPLPVPPAASAVP